MRVRELIDRLEEFPDYYEVEIHVVAELKDTEFTEAGVGFAIIKSPVVQVDSRSDANGAVVVLS